MRLFLAILAVAVSTPAQSADEAQSYAKVASDVAQAIYMGTPLQQMPAVPKLSDGELAEISKLAGCKPKLKPGGSKNYVAFDWLCDAGSPSGDSAPAAFRTTALRFDDQGRIFSFTVNPVVGNFAPTPTAVAMTDLPKKKDIAKYFGKAVREGKDATLNGLIPLADFQLEQLKPFIGRRVEIYGGDADDENILVVWQVKHSPGKGDFSAEMSFDGNGRPIGVILGASLIRRETFTTTEPL